MYLYINIDDKIKIKRKNIHFIHKKFNIIDKRKVIKSK